MGGIFTLRALRIRAKSHIQLIDNRTNYLFKATIARPQELTL